MADKAKLTFRSPVDGIVIQRDVVAGNLYDNSNVLMVIAPLDELWVWVNVYERDQGKVALGQRMVIQFPFLEQSAHGTVEFVASEVSQGIARRPGPGVDPQPGRPAEGRHARQGGARDPAGEGPDGDPPAVDGRDQRQRVRVREEGRGRLEGRSDKFERRTIAVAQENSDFVVVAGGLAAGERVATSGSLILAQLYEDLEMVDSGMPVQ